MHGLTTQHSDSNRLRLRAQVPIAAALALLLLICAAAAWFGFAGQRQAAQAAHEDAIESIAGTLRDDLLAAQSNGLFYLATGRPAYLQTYDSQAAAIATALDRLDAALDPTDLRTAVARTLQSQVLTRLGAMHKAIALAQSGQPEAARALVNSSDDSKLSTAIDASLTALRKTVGTLRTRRAKSEDTQ